MARDLMGFAAELASEIKAQKGNVTKLTVSESDEPQYPYCYYVRVEDGVRWSEYWVSHLYPHDSVPMRRVVEYLLHRLKHGDPIKVHVPDRLKG